MVRTRVSNNKVAMVLKAIISVKIVEIIYLLSHTTGASISMVEDINIKSMNFLDHKTAYPPHSSSTINYLP